MSLELLNTVASLATVVIVAAAAVAALIQLRHLRASNEIHAMLNVADRLDDRVFREALATVNSDLESALADPAFRDYEIAIFRRLPPPQIDRRYVDIHYAAVLVGNTFEMLGLLVKHRIVDPTILIDQYCAMCLGAWKGLEHYTALGREAMIEDIGWENFEYLAVLSQDWMQQHPSVYPTGVRRMPLRCPWPVPAAAVSP